eukprot:scaffold846_cov336-Pavlova_lutheri.AAC.13
MGDLIRHKEKPTRVPPGQTQGQDMDGNMASQTHGCGTKDGSTGPWERTGIVGAIARSRPPSSLYMTRGRIPNYNETIASVRPRRVPVDLFPPDGACVHACAPRNAHGCS